MAEFGVYVHFPYCRRLCPYCDFAVAVAHPAPPHHQYLEAILHELAQRAPDYRGRSLASIYFGGGTPSLWDPACLAAAVAAIRAAFSACPPSEITIEANPTDCTPAQLAAWRSAGIDRVSIGVQSVDGAELRQLGRDHRHGDGVAAVVAARAGGMHSISADAILGTPSQVPPTTTACTTVAALADAGADHISAYELTIEERTSFGKRVRAGRMLPRSEDELLEAYLAVDTLLGERGFEHYEVSSYARAGHRARHNSLYWRGREYLGLGAGAASFLLGSDGDATRQLNPRRARDYLAAPTVAAERTWESPDEVRRDRVWLALRTTDGATAEMITAAEVGPDLEPLTQLGLLQWDGGRLRPTLRGLVCNDQISRRVLRQGR